MKKNTPSIFWYVIFFLCTASNLFGQENTSGEKTKHKVTFRDTLDGRLDMSDFLINANGFIPMPLLVTEPALGNFGGGMAAIFLKKRAPQVDSIRGKRIVIRTPPDITGGLGLYTANNSWVVGAFRSGYWVKARSKYRVVGAFANINLSFYRNNLAGEEKEYEFNIRTVPVMGTFLKDFKGTYWSTGISYTLLDTRLNYNSTAEFVTPEEKKSLISMPGIVVEFDNRDNVFTPDKGVRMQASLSWSDAAFGSDFDYLNFSLLSYGYLPLRKNLIGGMRVEMQQVFDSPPFYLLPYIHLRGIPVARYQGNIYSVLETEFRWDFVRRWSAVFFAGSGKAYDEWNEFDDSAWRSSAGAGFRYLTARLFNLRMGVDVARGPEQWTYYIVFGSSWLR